MKHVIKHSSHTIEITTDRSETSYGIPALVVDDDVVMQIPPVLEIEQPEKTTRDRKLSARCHTLATAVRAIKSVYNDNLNQKTQKDFVETMIGAAIWYLPQAGELWTGMISMDALEALRAGTKATKLTKDHNYPRKCAARELLEMSDEQLTEESVLHLYKTRYGRFNFVTNEENRRLVKYQKAKMFSTPENAYSMASVTLVRVPLDEARELQLQKAPRKTRKRELVN
jgi:hypothetical protein